MTIRYARGLAAVFLVLGAVLVLLQLVLLGHRAGSFIALVPGVINLVLGIGYLTRPFFELQSGAVVFRAVLGPARKTHPFERLSDLRIQGGALYIGERKTGARRWMSHKGDWAALEARIATGVAETFE